MTNGNWEARITVLEKQNETICEKVDDLNDSVKEIRDNHLLHLRRQIVDLKIELERYRREVTEHIAALSAALTAKDAELDKRLAIMAVRMGAATSIITTIANLAINFLLDRVV